MNNRMTYRLCKLLPSLVILLLSRAVSAQVSLPELTIEDESGASFNTRVLLEDKKPVILTFWSTTCKPCFEELQAFKNHFKEWSAEYPFSLIAVSVDDVRFASRVKALVASNKWPARIILDQNQHFKRALNVNAIPQLFLFNQDGSLVYTHIGYTPGSEYEVYNALEKLYNQ
jgi:cytochrome c biogenesis protein CcmG/thiol:disulfide interchange protein DsbE